MRMILRLDNKPSDPIEAIIWLDGVLEAVTRELDDAYAESYFTARLQRRFPEAVAAGRLSKKRALALTRKRNERLGRSVRWSDGLDPTSSAYSD